MCVCTCVNGGMGTDTMATRGEALLDNFNQWLYDALLLMSVWS